MENIESTEIVNPDLIEAIKELVGIAIERLRNQGKVDQGKHLKLFLRFKNRIYKIAINDQSRVSLEPVDGRRFRSGLFISHLEVNSNNISVQECERAEFPIFPWHIDEDSIKVFKFRDLKSFRKMAQQIRHASVIPEDDWEKPFNKNPFKSKK